MMAADETTMQLIREEGKAEGRTERDSFFVKSLFQSTNFEDEKIATLAGVSLRFVREMKKELYGPYLTVSKTEEIAIWLMKRDGVDIRKYFEKKETLMAAWEKNGTVSDEEIKAFFGVPHL